MYTLLIVAAILVSLVVIHELGHFITAKLFGIRVEEFGVGYPPRAFTFGVWGGTEYTLNWLPFGGFVRLWGEENVHKYDPRGFVHAAWWKQILVLIAGVIMNVLAAWVLFAIALHIGLPRSIATSEVTPTTNAQLVISEVYSGSPAALGGLRAGDIILDIRDSSGNKIDTLTPESVKSYVQKRGGQRINITYMHLTATTTTTIIPANGIVPNAPAQPALGIGMRLVANLTLPWKEAFEVGATNTYQTLVGVSVSLWDLLAQSLRGTAHISDIVGPVGLVGVVHDAAQNGLGTVFALAAFISINLAVINSIPLPALDGGRVVLVLIETLLRRRIPAIVIQTINTIGVALILLLMIVVTYHDVVRLFV